MDPKRWKQVEKLCQAALELKEEERADFLDEACKGDEALRREVESLLEQERKVGDFVEIPVVEMAGREMVEDESSGMIGKTVQRFLRML